jgi:hypothetical protein
MSGRNAAFIAPKWIAGPAITTSLLAEKGPALFNTSTIDVIWETVPLHFQLPVQQQAKK